MKFLLPLSLAFSVTAFGADPRGDSPDAKPSTPEEERNMFHLPPGFEIQLVAAEPEIQKPINLNFDSAGRLWVSGSEMYPWPAGTDAQGKAIPDFVKSYEDIANTFGSQGKAPAPSQKALDTIRVLSDFDETGHARKIETFADGLNIPGGVQPLPRKPGAKGDTMIVYSIPNIYQLEDTDGDGRADRREVLYGTSTFLDTHGGVSNFLYWVDGWIYGTHGFRNHSEIRDKNGKVTVMDSGNTYRFRPDGSAFEIYTHGQTNPFGLTVDPLGNFYTADSHSKPVYMLLPGACYEGIGKQHDGLGFAPRITDDDHGSTAIAGIAYYAADQFPEEYRGNLFNGNPVTRRINRDKLEWHGSTPKAIRQPDFLTCDDPWFRPVQVKLGPDGALYIADFYNPIIGHYEVPLFDPRRDHLHGRIWRIVWKGDSEMPDLSSLTADTLVGKLADPNLIVRTLATNELADRIGTSADGSLLKVARDESVPDFQHVSALWALGRVNKLDNRLMSAAGKDSSPMVRAHLPQLLELMEKGDRPALLDLTNDPDASVRRSAIRLLAGGDEENIRTLLKMWASTPADDLELVHAIRIALRDSLLFKTGHQSAELAVAGNPQNDERIAEVSLGAKTPEAAEFLIRHLGRTKLRSSRSGEFIRHAVVYLPQEKLETITPLIENNADAPLQQRLLIADNLAQGFRQRGIPLPDAITSWTQRTMLDALASRDEALLARAIESLRETTLEAKLDPLAKVAEDRERTDKIRIAALEALANLERGADSLVRAMNDSTNIHLQKRAAELLSQRGISKSSDPFLDALPTAPVELAITISTSLAGDDGTCDKLLSTIEHGKAAPSLLRNTLVASALERRSPVLRERAAALTQDLPAENVRLDQLIADRVGAYQNAQPDAARGAQIFSQQCTACHRLRNVGANLGPALDGVGGRGIHRLAEDILDPNRNVDPIFRQTVIRSTDGQTYAGLNAREEGDLLLLNDATGKPISLSKSKIESRTTSTLSLMPASFESTIPERDFQDLLGYLLGTAEK
ncbi:MAG: PVC-type heme-binding CxxCH protein [Luteolibacter sp.]|uniref:PVC-type heme-binding CxxCH protein n=1 Tax=Luteolibacter sp. TaxID=1962973 RepID=UPI0032660184